MSRFIATLLAKEKSATKTILEKLETASGEHSTDSRLISEIIVKSRMKIKQLGLDPEDTTADELYSALDNLVRLHDGFLARAIGSSPSDKVSSILPKITKFTNSVAKTKSAWCIKHSVAKRLLSASPPKVLMKRLGYRSIDSMVKRESIDDLFAGIQIAESADFIRKFYERFKKLHPSDFESRRIVVRQLNQKKWQDVGSSHSLSSRSNVIELKELGAVIIAPLPVEKLSGTTIMVLPLVLHRINEIHIYSSYFKFIQVKQDFGEVLASVLLNEPNPSVDMAGLDVGWEVIREHFGQLTKKGLSDVFEPHIQLDDLEKKSVEESLYQLEPALHFWFGNDCLGLPYDNRTVSFNLMDVATNYVNRLRFGQNTSKYLQESLWDELLKRYISEEPLHDQVLQQLDRQVADNEFDDQSIPGAVFA